MTDLMIKANAASDKATQTPGGRDNVSTLAGLAGSFQDMLHKAGARIEDGFSALASRAGFSAQADRADAPRPADDYGRDQGDDAQDRLDNSARNADNGDDRSGTHRADREDNQARDHGGDNRDEGGDARDSEHGESAADDRGGDQGNDETGERDAASNEDQGGGQQADSDDSGDGETRASSNAGDDGQGTGGEAAGQDGAGQTANGNTAGTQVNASGEAATSTLLDLISGGEGLGVEGHASDQGKTSSAEGIATAAQNIAAAAGQDNTAKEMSQGNGANNGQRNTHQAQAAANASEQAKAVANEGAAGLKETQTNTPLGTVETQASGIAKALGDGNKAQVTVSVINESQNLTSKPNAALATNTVLSGERSSQSSSGQQAGSHSQSGGNQGQTAQAQQAQQAQAANAQTQGAQNSAAQAGADAKGLVQAQSVSSTSSAASTHAGGGEGVTQAGGVTGAQQTQQSQGQTAAEKASNTQKPEAAGRTVVDQISVKISKAIQAGSDKITIQLRPANMGRVEVKLEMIQDNRLSAMVVADSKETLDLLQKDSRELQRALQDAGLHAESGDLNFSLRGEENQAQKDGDASPRPLSGDEDLAELEEMIVEEAVIASDGRVLANGRIDVRA